MGFLTDKTAAVRRELARRPLDDGANLARALALPPARDFAGALRGERPAIIAEVKRASPSVGDIATDRDPVEQARAYADGGAAAISVLTDHEHFGGSLADLRAIRIAVQLPLLRKDFLVHPSQIIEARAAGADAVLLIAASLSPGELDAMLGVAGELGLGALVETHSPDDLDKALASTATVVGVNARDLETLEVDLDRALEQLARVPHDRVAVLESGVATRAQLEAAVSAGASAILMGEALMRSPDPRATLRALRGAEA
jgi:indole-3-glycerol phosphate synthase